MDTLEFFASRVKSVTFYQDEPAKWRKKTVIHITSVENHRDVSKENFGIVDNTLADYPGEMMIINEMIGLIKIDNHTGKNLIEVRVYLFQMLFVTCRTILVIILVKVYDLL